MSEPTTPLPVPSPYCIIFVTVPSSAVGQQLARVLVESRLAACVKLFPVQSVYTWEGAVQADEEWQLLIKTRSAQFAAVESTIRTHHPYEVPEIVAIPVLAGSQTYLGWIDASVSG